MAASLYTSRVVLLALGVSDYGIYNLVAGFVTMLGFLNGAMSAATQRYLSFDLGLKDEGKLQNTFSTTLVIHIAIALVVLLLGETIGIWFLNSRMNFPPERTAAVNVLFQFSLLTFIISIIQVPYNALILARERMRVYAVMSVLEVVLKLFIALSLIYLSGDKLVLLGLLTLLVTLIIRVLYVMYCRREFPDSKFKFTYDWRLFRELIIYSGWNLFGSISLIFRGQGVNVVLNLFFGTVINASYGIASQVQGAVTQFVTSFQTALNPQIIQSYAADDKSRSLSLILMGSKLSFFIMLLIIIPLIYNAEYIMNFWLDFVPEKAIVFVQISLVSVLVDALSGPLMIGIQATGKIKWYQIIVGASNILSLAVVYIVLFFGGASEEAFLVLFFFSCLSLFLRLCFLSRGYLIGFKELFVNLLYRVTLVSCIAFSFGYYVNTLYPELSFYKLIMFVVTQTLVTLIAAFIFGLTIRERGYTMSLVKLKFRK